MSTEENNTGDIRKVATKKLLISVIKIWILFCGKGNWFDSFKQGPKMIHKIFKNH